MIYKLDSNFPMTDDNTYYDINDGVEIPGVIGWARGEKFSVEIENPILIPITRIGDYEGSDLAVIPFNDANLCIATPEIANSLLECGITNLQIYPAILKDTDTGQEYSYVAINIIGFADLENLAKANKENPDQPFMFRLKKNSGTIVINEKVKSSLEKFQYLEFIKLC